MWQRVFGRSDGGWTPAQIAEGLAAAGHTCVPHFKGDDLGWTTGELHFPSGSPVLLARYLTKPDELRADLNAFAAELETMTYSPNAAPLMERVIQTQQMVTLRKPFDHGDEIKLDAVCEFLVQSLASASDGLYQIDGKGWFTASGELLVQEY
jgi:hypothetical protein